MQTLSNAQDIDIAMPMYNLIEYSDLEVYGNSTKMILMITWQNLNHLNLK